jgi:hypothetical protein
MKQRLGEQFTRLTADRRALRDTAVALVLVIGLALVGLRGWRTADAHSARSSELQEMLRVTDGWDRRLALATAAESLQWQASREAAGELSFDARDRLQLLELVGQRATAVGVPDARVEIINTPGAVQLAVDGWRLDPVGFQLYLAVTADYWTIVALLGALPPMLEVSSLRLARYAARPYAEITVAVYEAREETRPPIRDASQATAAQLAPLASYLMPSTSSRPEQTIASAENVRDPFGAAAPRRAAAPPVRAVAAQEEWVPRWTVTAILITEARRVAVIDQRVVTLGDTLQGGGRVHAIQPGHVIVQDRSGRSHQLALAGRTAP